jgi:hypothetical protein
MAQAWPAARQRPAISSVRQNAGSEIGRALRPPMGVSIHGMSETVGDTCLAIFHIYFQFD